MRHRFLLAHNQFIPVRKKQALHPGTFKRARDCAMTPVDLPPLVFGSRRDEIERSVMLMKVWLNMCMGDHYRLPTADQYLLRSVLLRRLLQELHAKIEDPQLRSYQCARAGHLLQRQMVLLLLSTPSSCHSRLLQVGEMRGVSSEHWMMNLLGASGEAYTLRVLASRPNGRIFFPTAVEDMLDATDIFWLERDQRFAVSVKTQFGTEPSEQARCILSSPKGGSSVWTPSHLKAIWRGCGQHRAHFGQSYTPVAVQITVLDQQLARLNRHWDQIRWPRTLLQEVRQHAA